MSDYDLNRREALGTTVAALSAALLGCQRDLGKQDPSLAPADGNRRRIEAALAALLERQSEHASVIFEEKMSGKFVQFAGSAREGLLLDLPSQTLDGAEMGRAKAYFLELGVHAEEYDVFDGPGGKVVGRECFFQKEFGRDARAAAAVASEVFRRVYGFPPDFELTVTEN